MMASLSHQFYTLVLLLTICRSGLGCKDEPVTDDIAGSSVHIEVHPESINELITDEISITCTPKDLPQGTQDILFMELGKEGEHPLATLKGPALKLGSDMKNNMQARGHNAKNVSESFLQLTIKRPFVDDVNVYCCRMFYQNEFGELKMGHVYADVSIENNDKAVFVYLLERVSNLENDKNDLEKDLVKQQNYTNDLENNLLNLERTVKEQEKQRMDQNTKVSSRFDELEVAGMNRSAIIQDIVDRDSFSSAFSIYGTKSPFSAGETLVFKQFLLNVGNHYNMATGVFTAPKKGLYVFHLSVRIHSKNEFGVDLKVNGVISASMYAYDNGSHAHTSVSAILLLDTGDEVLPYVRNGGKPLEVNGHSTVFSGYLLKLL